MSRKKICTIGGGTGNFVLLDGLKQYNVDLSAIVSMADDGGSTGILRDELGVLPAGDTRQCLVALSHASRLMRDLMNYRFDTGNLEGHSFGNLFLSALEKVTGSFEQAIEEVGKILNMRGKVIPVTTEKVRLNMVLQDGTRLCGEKTIYLSEAIDQGYQSLFLTPQPQANRRAIDEIMNADVVVLGPGGLFTSLIPNLLVDGVAEALRNTGATKVFIVNLMNRKGQTTGYGVSDYLQQIVRYIGQDVFDVILVNNKRPPSDLMERYKGEGELVLNDLTDDRVIEIPLLGELAQPTQNDNFARNLIRHHRDIIAREICKIADYTHV